MHLTSKQKKFKDVYLESLMECIQQYPNKYCYGEQEAMSVCDKMFDAFMRHTANKDGMAVKKTCKKLGISYTYKGISEYLGVSY
jgi:hypothetical protein